MRYHYFGPGDGLWMIGGLLLLIAVIVLTVWAVMTLMRREVGPGRDVPRDPARPTPNEILRERFARGEITEEQFEQAKRVLGPDR